MLTFASPLVQLVGRGRGTGVGSVRLHWPQACARGPAASPAPRLLFLGASGRVGSSTIESVVSFAASPLDMTVCSRSLTTAQSVAASLSTLHPSHSFSAAQADISCAESLGGLIAGHDVIVHTAGPFQLSKTPSLVLEECIRFGKDYIDVCDDADHARVCKGLAEEAEKSGSRCLVGTGIYPGISNLMAMKAAELVGDGMESVRLYYFTAGSGGIGKTVLASTFLLLGEDAIWYDVDGNRRVDRAGSRGEEVDFGGKIGKRGVYLLNLPEVDSLRGVIFGQGGGEVSAKFGTAPDVWNILLLGMVKWVPRWVLRERELMGMVASLSLGVVRIVDWIVGGRTGMLVVGKGGGKKVRVIYEHESLRSGVGEAVAGFVEEVVWGGGVDSGVWFVEELGKGVRERVLKRGICGAEVFRVEEWDEKV